MYEQLIDYCLLTVVLLNNTHWHKKKKTEQHCGVLMFYAWRQPSWDLAMEMMTAEGSGEKGAREAISSQWRTRPASTTIHPFSLTCINTHTHTPFFAMPPIRLALHPLYPLSHSLCGQIEANTSAYCSILCALSQMHWHTPQTYIRMLWYQLHLLGKHNIEVGFKTANVPWFKKPTCLVCYNFPNGETVMLNVQWLIQFKYFQ